MLGSGLVSSTVKNYNSFSLTDKKALLFSEYGIQVEGHAQKLSSIAITDDQTHLITGDESGVIKKWNIQSGNYEGSFIGHTYAIANLIVFKNHLITSEKSKSQHIFVWDINSMKKVATFSQAPIPPKIIKIETKTQTLVYTTESGMILIVYSLKKNALSYQKKFKRRVQALSFSSNTNTLYVGFAGKIIGYNLLSGIKIEKSTLDQPLFLLEISPDSQSMIQLRNKLEIWHEDLKPEPVALRQIKYKKFSYNYSWGLLISDIISIISTKDSKYFIVACKDKSLRVIDLKYQKVHHLYEFLNSIPQCMCLIENHKPSDKDSISIVLGHDKYFYVYEFHIKDYFSYHHDVGIFNSFVLTDNGKILIGSKLHYLEVNNLEKNERLEGFEINVLYLLRSNKNVYFVCYTDGKYDIVSVDLSYFSSSNITPESFNHHFKHNKCTEILKNAETKYYSSQILIDQSESQLAIIGVSSSTAITLQVFDLLLNKMITEKNVEGHWNYFTVNMKEKLFVYAAHESNKFYVHEFDSENSLSYVEFNSFITCFSVNKSQEDLFIGTNHGTVFVWCFKSKHLICSIPLNNVSVESIFCGNNNILGINYADKSVSVVVFKQVIKKNVLKVHNGTVNNIHFSNDMKIAYSIGNDRSIKTWNLRTGELINIIRTKYHMTGICFTPDDKFATVFTKELYFFVCDTEKMKELFYEKYDKKFFTSFIVTDNGRLYLGVSEKKILYTYILKKTKELKFSKKNHR
ncbi:hypothetical protein SteCoe_5150 [Stentor coeruleus]|uniref:Anaphase-promoting complex subunit 4 WD40 domain-containing protein n=1 Tax=Stentor coeruleus TaxID=5963 RepID=A0A1R2CT78_9CILI|nr:hypothetical protein SteCoe_5150 [Stentor coeruleus]